jgi:hypothetical protein
MYTCKTNRAFAACAVYGGRSWRDEISNKTVGNYSCEVHAEHTDRHPTHPARGLSKISQTLQDSCESLLIYQKIDMAIFIAAQ